MQTKQQFRQAILGFAAVLGLVLVAPVAAQNQDEEAVSLAPAEASWDETSGYGAVEASRAVIGLAYVVGGQEASGHEASFAIGQSWDETSGYASVETSRAFQAIVAAPDVITSHVPSDVRFAPSAPASLLDSAQLALASGDLGGMQEEALTILVASGMSWDQTSGYASVEDSRAAYGPR